VAARQIGSRLRNLLRDSRNHRVAIRSGEESVLCSTALLRRGFISADFLEARNAVQTNPKLTRFVATKPGARVGADDTAKRIGLAYRLSGSVSLARKRIDDRQPKYYRGFAIGLAPALFPK
jgi:hypothetical protein